MNETLAFAAISTPFVAGILIHRAGVVYTIRVIGNWWWALAFATEHFRREFRRLNAEAKELC